MTVRHSDTNSTDENSNGNHRATAEYEQLLLPLDVRQPRAVYWLNAVEERRREKLFGRKVVTAALILEDGTYSPSKTTLDSNRISELTDPDLRYALRYADAASSAGWKVEGPGALSGHHVMVMATDEGLESRFLEASYTGIVDQETDSFLENLHRFSPGTNQV